MTPSPYPGHDTVSGDLVEALRKFKQLPLESRRQVPATTPARERLANPPMAHQAPSIDLGPGYPAEPPTREFSRKQLAMLDEIKVSMQKLLRSGLPAENKSRQMLPADMAEDLAQRYGVAEKRIRGINPQNPTSARYGNAVAEALDLRDPRTDATVLEDLVKEILERFLGRLAPRQRPYKRTAVEDVNRSIVPRVLRTVSGGLDYWTAAPGDSRFGQ